MDPRPLDSVWSPRGWCPRCWRLLGWTAGVADPVVDPGLVLGSPFPGAGWTPVCRPAGCCVRWLPPLFDFRFSVYCSA